MIVFAIPLLAVVEAGTEGVPVGADIGTIVHSEEDIAHFQETQGIGCPSCIMLQFKWETQRADYSVTWLSGGKCSYNSSMDSAVRCTYVYISHHEMSNIASPRLALLCAMVSVFDPPVSASGQEDLTSEPEDTFSWKNVLKDVLRLRKEDRLSEGMSALV